MEPAIFTALLSPREHKCIKLLCNGRRQREIAKTMKCTIGTVGVYMSRIRSKLDARTNAQAAVKYLQLAVPAVALEEPAVQADSFPQPSAQVTLPDTAPGGNGGGIQADQNPLDTQPDSGPATATVSAS